MSVDVWCKNGDDKMQDVIVEEDPVRFCRVTTDEDVGGGGGPNGSGVRGIAMDKDEKRMRREIANSNERRRMQSINAGFQSLRQMLPHHEGEKLSKAAILQQTAEYIYSLEQEKTRLLSQNCHLKRLLDQQDHNGSIAASAAAENQPISTTQTATGTTTVIPAVVAQPIQPAPPQATATTTTIATVAKKRKIDNIMAVQPVSDSSDEGLGSMSPEPVSLMQVVSGAAGQTVVATATVNGRSTCTTINVSAKDYLDMKHQLDIERRQKAVFEERLKALERQIYPARVLYQDHTDVLEANETVEEIAVPNSVAAKIGRDLENVQLITLESGKKQLVLCGTEVIEETIISQSIPKPIVPLKEEKVYVKRSRSRSPTIEQHQQQHQPQQTTVVTLPPKKNRYPTILEAAIKAEPKVEVERIDSPSSIVVSDDHLSHLTSSKLVSSQQQQQQQATSRINTCRHNLETIVEAIRHLEGDAFDAVIPTQQQQQPGGVPRPVQEVPLALTTSSKQQKQERDHRQSQLEPYLKFRTTPSSSSTSSSSSATSSSNPSAANPAIVSVSITPSPAASLTSSASTSSTVSSAQQILQQHQQCRPGVIVVKQNS